MIPLIKNTFIEELETRRRLAEFILSTERLSMGPLCEQFEKDFAAFQGRRDAVLFNSGGSANIALLQALKNLNRLKEKDLIGFSALTWSTNVMPIIQMGMEPLPVDCQIDTLNVSSETLKERLGAGMRALFITNALGFAGDLPAIRDLCRQHDILLLEDNCEALGTIVNGERTGNFGLASTFSFFVAHHMSTIEGGMCCTDDDELAEMLRIVRANGWDRNLQPAQQIKWRERFRIHSEFTSKYTFYDLGFNLRPTEITGFLGSLQLAHLPRTIEQREKNYLTIEEAMKQNPDLHLIQRDHLNVCSAFAIPIVCKTAELKDRYLDQFSGAGVEIRPMIAGNIQKQPFYQKYVSRTHSLPQSDFLHTNSFYCGNYPELSTQDTNTLISCLHKYDG